MSKLDAAERKKLPTKVFGLPQQRKYPMPDRQHAALAKSYAARDASPAERKRIDAKANRILYPGMRMHGLSSMAA